MLMVPKATEMLMVPTEDNLMLMVPKATEGQFDVNGSDNLMLMATDN